MVDSFCNEYKIEAYKAHDDSGLINIDLYKATDLGGWGYRLTLKIRPIDKVWNELDNYVQALIEIDKKETE